MAAVPPDSVARLLAGADSLAEAMARLQRDAAIQQGLHDLVVAMGRSGTPHLPPDRLEGFCVDVARLFEADRVDLWQHDRQARRLDRTASSDRRQRTQPVAVSTEDPTSFVAMALRRPSAILIPGAGVGPDVAQGFSPAKTGAGLDDEAPCVTAAVPLKGRRRALGTLVVHGIRIAPGDEARTVERLDGLGHQLGNVLESAQLMDQVLRTRRELEQSETMGHLVAGIAHELNNPLQAVLGHLELLHRTERLSPRLAASMRQIYRESDRAARIVKNLLLLAGSGKVVRRPVSVNAAVRRALALRRPSCRHAGIVIERHLGDAVPRVPGDALLLQQMFHNLLLNAEQALSAAGGRIEVRTTYAARRRQVIVEIHDTGPGITADVLPRIFDPFFTTKDAGSGLGLPLAQRIIREHGGDLEASNHRAGGAVFTVHLPAGSVIK
ncbi:MAG: ATP-binding protein [Acidobacteria bacterium]|nr:ATP-binding protein [Acidobacteriota bacterium]